MKYALVTGGSRGIGRAVSVKLAQMGYRIIINYVNNTTAAEETLALVREAGSDGEMLKFDVGNAGQVKPAIEGWQAAHADQDEYIEVVVNNAGIRRDNLMALMPEEDWFSVINTTLNGFFNVTAPLISQMQFHKFGRIINMASVSGIMGMQGQTNYSAAKGGLVAATKALAKEVARKNITVNAVAPGFIKTDMVEGLDEKELKKTIPANRFGQPEEVLEISEGQQVSEVLRDSLGEQSSEQTVQEVQETPVVAVTKPQKYYLIIVCSCTTQEDAEYQMHRLEKLGYNGLGILPRDGRYRIFINTFDVKTDAETYLNALRENKTFADAWLLAVRPESLSLIIKNKDNDQLPMELSHLNKSAERDQG